MTESQLVEAIQRRLHTSGPLPKSNIVMAAIAMARDASLKAAAACDAANPPVPRGSRARAAEFRDRIIRENLLAAPAPQPAAPQDKLLVSPDWLAEHCPKLTVLGWTVVGSENQQAMYTIDVRVDGLDEIQQGTVAYDLAEGDESSEERQRRRACNRQREEKCLRALDGAAADQQRARKSELQRQQRHGDGEVILSVVERMMKALERQQAAAEREAWRQRCTWRCPGGCKPGASSCARVAWRCQMMPSQAMLEGIFTSQLHSRTWQHIEYRSPSGYRYGAAKQKQLAHADWEEHTAACDEITLTEEEYAEERLDFLATWDGIIPPYYFWIADQVGLHEQFLSPEYLGCDPQFLGLQEVSLRWYRCPGVNSFFNFPQSKLFDQFGDLRPLVGPIVCARIGCDGCCYCRGVTRPPRMVQFSLDGLGRIEWAFVPDLTSSLLKHASHVVHLPAEQSTLYVVAGAFRAHLSATDLDRLSNLDCIVLCRNESSEIVLEHDETARVQALFNRHNRWR